VAQPARLQLGEGRDALDGEEAAAADVGRRIFALEAGGLPRCASALKLSVGQQRPPNALKQQQMRLVGIGLERGAPQLV